jgi:hypothetical protein
LRRFIALDGPRPDRPGEAALCAEVRRIVEDDILPDPTFFPYCDELRAR